MIPSTRPFRLWLVAAFIMGCGPTAAPPKEPPRPPAGKLGEACTSKGGLSQGTCAAGLACLTSAPAGYCTAVGSCSGGTHFDTLATPELCGKTCNADADCRSGEGYACDPVWKVCTAPGMAAPKPPTCSAAALTRKSFGRVTQISGAKAGATTYGPSVAFDREGDLVTAYNIGLPQLGPNTIGISKAAIGGNDIMMIDQDRPVSFEHENKLDPWLAQDRNGKLYMTWVGFDGAAAESHMQVLIATSDDGVNWSKPVVASDANTDCAGDQAHCLGRPLVEIGPDRNNPKADVIYVIYHSAVSGGLRATHSNDNAATFSPSAAVGPGLYADAEVTQSGKIHVVYVAAGTGSKMGDPGNGVYYTNSGDGGASFAAPVRISSENEPVPVYFASPQVVVDAPRRLLYSVYPQGGSDGKWEIVLATSKDGGVSWSRASVNDDSPCATHMLPSAALDAATGKVHIIWVENRSGQGQIGYAACNTGGEKCGKNEAASDGTFAGFSLGRNSAHWLGDSVDVVVDTKHKLLHAVWTQTVDENGQVTGRVFTSAAKLK
jgi:BNR repeat-like domain